MIRLLTAAVLFALLLGILPAHADYRAGLRAYGAGKFSQAQKIWLAAARGGERRAQFRLGRMQVHGVGVKQQPEAGSAWLIKAARAGSMRARLELAELYFIGERLPNDYAAALRWSQAAAEAGSAQGYYNLGRLYDRGLGVELDYAKAREYFSAAAAAGWPAAQGMLAHYHYAGIAGDKDRDAAVSLWRQAADGGDVDAVFELAERYRQGQGVEQDHARARALYRRAAKAGEGRAQHDLAVYLFDKKSEEWNEKEAEFWLQRAAAQGLAVSQLRLARRGFRDHAAEGWLIRAFEWFGKAFRRKWPAATKLAAEMEIQLPRTIADTDNISDKVFSQSVLCLLSFELGKGAEIDAVCKEPAEQDNPWAQYVMARVEDGGIGRVQNRALATYWYARAARIGLPVALNALGRIYLREGKTRQAGASGARLIRRAAVTGYPPAQFNLGYMHEQGLAVAKDATAAAHWYRRAAHAGHARAQFNLATLLLRGKGLGKNRRLAYVWLVLAGVRQGVDRKEGRHVRLRAERLRRQLEAQMTPRQIEQAKRHALSFRPT